MLKDLAKCGVCMGASMLLSVEVFILTGSVALFCGVNFTGGVAYSNWLRCD